MASDDNMDPIRVWREWFVKSEKSWSDALSEMMGDEHFSKGMGRYTLEALHTHRMFSETMAQYLANLNIPSRSDILDMNDRLAHMDQTLNQIQVELREQRTQMARLAVANGSVVGVSTGTTVRPARTRKPSTNLDA